MASEEYSQRRGWHNPEDIKELAAALAVAQGNIDNVKKDRINPHFKSNYATLGSVWDTIRDELSKNGLAVVQLPTSAPAGSVGLLTRLIHKSGQSLEEVFYMPVAQANNPQAVGSALTYARRYALMALVGIAPEDDDGNAAKTAPKAKSDAPSQEFDWAKASEDMLVVAKKEKDASNVRGMFAKVRNSPMPEPGKMQLLTSLETIIRDLEKKDK